MAGKQSNDSMVNAQDNGEWLEAEKPVTPEQSSVEPVQLPVTPASVLRIAMVSKTPREPVYVFSPGALRSMAERRTRKARVTFWHFASRLVAWMSIWNVLWVFRAPTNEIPSADIVFNALKVIIGVCGAVVLETKKFSAIKTYALAWFAIYASWYVYYVHRANTYWYDRISEQCARNQHMGFESYTDCVQRNWWTFKQEALVYALYTLLGVSITFTYALSAAKFWEAENQSRNEDISVCDV